MSHSVIFFLGGAGGSPPVFPDLFSKMSIIYGPLEGTVPDLRTKRSGVVESGLSMVVMGMAIHFEKVAAGFSRYHITGKP